MPKHRIENVELGFEGRIAGAAKTGARVDPHRGNQTLKVASRVWFTCMAAGQLLFLSHIALFYSRAALSGDMSLLNKTLAHGFQSGDRVGNSVLALHIAMAGMLTFGGSLQLVPQIRAMAPQFHRWLGRIYLGTALLGAGSALWLSVVRQLVPGTFWDHLGVNLNAVLILVFAAVALNYALKRDFRLHRVYALRLFLMVSGVWFFRVLFFFWLLINDGHPVGIDLDKFEGPVLTLFSYMQYLLPLAALEVYLRAERSSRWAPKLAAACMLVVLTLVMAAGTFSYSMMLVHEGTLL